MPGAITPIRNGVLETDLDLNGFALTNSSGAGFQPHSAALDTLANSSALFLTLSALTSAAAFKNQLDLVRADVGLGSVDNTSDADKPVSTAQQTALNSYQTKAGVLALGGFSSITGRTGNANLPLGPQIYDNAGTPKLSADFGARKLFGPNGVTVLASWDDSTNLYFEAPFLETSSIYTDSPTGFIYDSAVAVSISWGRRNLQARITVTPAVKASGTFTFLSQPNPGDTLGSLTFVEEEATQDTDIVIGATKEDTAANLLTYFLGAPSYDDNGSAGAVAAVIAHSPGPFYNGTYTSSNPAAIASSSISGGADAVYNGSFTTPVLDWSDSSKLQFFTGDSYITSAGVYTGNGSGLTNLSGSSVSGGTFGAVNGSALTALNGSNISSGTVAFARLPTGTSSSTVAIGDHTHSGVYQPIDTDLTSWAAITRASGFDTFTATPSSVNLKALLTDETGSGALVFANTPTLVTPDIGAATGTSLNLAQGSSGAFALQLGSSAYGIYSVAASGHVYLVSNNTAIRFNNGDFAVRSLATIGFASGTSVVTSNPDTAFSRISAGLIGLGTGAQGAVDGNLQLNNLTVSGSGAASTPALKLSGVPFAGTGTTSFPLLYINDANATASTTLSTAGTYFGVNGDGTQDLMNLLKDGTSQFKVSSVGVATVTSISIPSLTSGNSSNLNFVAPSQGAFGEPVWRIGIDSGTSLGIRSNGQVQMAAGASFDSLGELSASGSLAAFYRSGYAGMTMPDSPSQFAITFGKGTITSKLFATEYGRWTPLGGFAIGTTTDPGAGNLTVAGGTLTGGSVGLSLAAGGTNQNITLTPSGTGKVIVASNIQFSSSSGTIQSSGFNVTLKFNDTNGFAELIGSLRPTNDAANSLGGSSNRWTDLYLSGLVLATPQALSGAGAVNVTTSSTAFTSTGGAQALTLANGTNGQIKTIAHVSDGGSGVLTPTTKSGFSTITFTNVGDAVTLQYFTTAGWIIVGQNGVTVAP